MYSILIIEDDGPLCNNMKLILEMEGFGVDTSPDGRQGVARLRESLPDLVLCDIMMPDMDGLAVLEVMRREEAFADTPFIFVTAMGDRTDVRRGMTAGADDYLPKPFAAEELVAAVTGCLNRREKLRRHFHKSLYQEEFATLHERTTEREREILQLVGRGSTSQEIAGQLGISLRTVHAHRTNLMNKLGADNAAMLSRWAVIAEHLHEYHAPPSK